MGMVYLCFYECCIWICYYDMYGVIVCIVLVIVSDFYIAIHVFVYRIGNCNFLLVTCFDQSVQFYFRWVIVNLFE